MYNADIYVNIFKIVMNDVIFYICILRIVIIYPKK